MVVFPIDNFLPDADLSALSERKQEFYDGLTQWQPRQSAATSSPQLEVSGADYETALIKVNDLLLARHWGDGLPLWPATEARTQWILRGATLPRDHIIGRFPPRGGMVTIESCAIALAMAGGRPEYLPVLVAAVDAFLDPLTTGDLLQATSGSPFPMIVVNGPIAKKIRLNSGFGILGPDPQHPAGASIGRALRLMQQNLGGALPGVGTMAVFGMMRNTNVVFAEDEDGLPAGWTPYVNERHGFAGGSNCLSLAFGNGATNVFRRGAKEETKEEDAVQGLHRIAGYMRVPDVHYLWGYDKGTPGLVVISKVVAAGLGDLGWTKKDVREFLLLHSKVPMAEMNKSGGTAFMKIASTAIGRDSIKHDPWPITSNANNIGLIVAGGGHSSHALWMQAYSPAVLGREIALPECFDELIKESRQQ